MTVENPYSREGQRHENTRALETTVDRVFPSPVRDGEFLSLTTAPLALFAQPLEDGSTRYTAQIGAEFSGNSLLRYLRTIAPFPKESLIGTVADWSFLYTGDYVTKPTFESSDDQERIRLLHEHAQGLPPAAQDSLSAWQTFMRHHAAPLLDAAADKTTLAENSNVPLLYVERYIASPSDQENLQILHESGVHEIRSHRFPHRVDVNMHNRLLLRYRYRYTEGYRTPFIDRYNGAQFDILAHTLSLMPVLQWTTTTNGERRINTGPIEGDREVKHALQQLYTYASPLERSLDTDPSRLSSLLGKMFLAYTTPDVRARERWAARATLRPDKDARPVREPQVPIRVLETDFSDHPFLEAAERYVQQPLTRSERLEVIKSTARHSLRSGVRNPFVRAHPNDI